jgi:autotransporter-associated beta strand protein
MKHGHCYSLAFLTLTFAQPVAADVIYSNLLNTAIPLDFTGVTLAMPGGGTINPFFGGAGVANNNLFQPGRTVASNLGTLQNFAVGSTIDSGLLLGTGFGGSQNHLGTTFTAGQEGFIGFKLNGANYGWMRVVFTANASGAVIKDWAYDNGGDAMVTGRIQQSAVLSGLQTVTLSPGSAETFTLGSVITNTGGNVNSVVKTGSGTTILKGTNTYTGTTVISEGTLALATTGSIDDTSSISLGTVGTLDVSAKSGSYAVGTLLGSGDVTGDLTVSTQLAIGNSVGEINFSSDLTLGSSSTSIFEIDGGSNPGLNSADLADVAGSLTIGSGAILDLFQLGTYTPGNKFTLFAYEGGLTGSFLTTESATIADDTQFSDAGGLWLLNYNDDTPGTNGGVSALGTYVTITAIPEPDVATLLGALALLCLIRRRH